MSWRDLLRRLIGTSGMSSPETAERKPIPLRPMAAPLRTPASEPGQQMRTEESDQPGFSATAGDQLRDRARSDLERARLKLRGVLTPSQPVMDPKAFAGRRKLLEKVIGAIEDQRLHVILFGSRGMGKTSLLHILTQRARDARYVVLYGSCGAGTTFNDMFRALCSEIPLRFYGPARAGGSPGDQGATIARILPDGDLTPRSVTEIFGKITGTRVLVILDEFDRSDSGAFRQSIADLIKTLSDRAVRAQLIIGGVGSNVTELIEHIPSIQRNIVGLQVPPLTDREVRHLLRITDEQVGVTFQPDAADLVVALTEGWPYVASLLSHHAALAAMGRRSMEVDRPDVIEALADAVQEVHGRLAPESRKEVEFTAVGETNALLELAARAHIHFGGEFTPENLIKVASDEELAARCSAKVEELARQDLLFLVREDRFGKTYSFKDSTVPLYIWLSRVKPEVAGPVTRETAS